MTDCGCSCGGGGIAPASPVELTQLVEYAKGSVVSRTLSKGPSGTLTAFAFDQGEGLSEHSAPFDAYVQVLDGQGVFTIGGDPISVKAGEILVMPANVPHAVEATERFKMLLIMFKSA